MSGIEVFIMSDGDSDASYEEIDRLPHYNSPYLRKERAPTLPIPVQPPFKPPSRHANGFHRSSSLPRISHNQITGWRDREHRAPSLSPPTNPGAFMSIDDRPPLPPPNIRHKYSKQRSSPGERTFVPASSPTQSPGSTHRPKRPAPKVPPNRPVVNGKPGPPVAPKRVRNSLSKSKSEHDLALSSDELSLSEFVDRYKDNFPVRIRVSKGFYGNSNLTSISEGDMFNVHFLKNTKVVVLDDGSCTEFKVALNSAIEFGLLYNPHKNKEAAKVGLMFEKVSDVMAMKTLPKVMKALEAYKGSSPESSVEANELLIVKSVKSKKLKGKVLKVYSPRLKKKKELPEGCCGKFSTKPYDVRMFLPEIEELLADSFPLQFMLYVNSDTVGEIPSSIVSNAVNLRRFEMETSLIASVFFFNEEQYEDGAPKLVEVPFDLDIEVQAMADCRDSEQLVQDTLELLENFDPMTSHSYVNVPCSSQVELYAAVHNQDRVRKEYERTGFNLEPPTSIALYVNGPDQSSTSTSSSHRRDRSSSTPSPPSKHHPHRVLFEPIEPSSVIYEDTSDRLQVAEFQKKAEQLGEKFEDFGGSIYGSDVQSVESDVKSLSRELKEARSNFMRIEGKVVRTVEEVKTVRSELERTVPLVMSLQNALKLVQAEMQALQNVQTTPNSAPPPFASDVNGASPPLLASNAEDIENNKLFLATLDSMQMVELLEFMGMKQYYTSFLSERVTGEIFLECDEQVLETELKVTSKIHRVRLMKIISGKHSAEIIMKGEDPYVYATKSI